MVITRSGPTIKGFIKKCVQCIKMRAEVVPYRMGNKAWLGDTKFGMGIFTHINCDIIGYFMYYPQGRVTRNSSAHKVWALVICCLYSKAINMTLMKDYSSTAFKMAMCSHFCRYGMPVVVTADNGSQIRRAAGEGDSVEMGNTSGALTAKDTSKNVALPGIFDWCTQAKGWLKGVLVYLALTDAKQRSGMVESHIRQFPI